MWFENRNLEKWFIWNDLNINSMFFIRNFCHSDGGGISIRSSTKYFLSLWNIVAEISRSSKWQKLRIKNIELMYKSFQINHFFRFRFSIRKSVFTFFILLLTSYIHAQSVTGEPAGIPEIPKKYKFAPWEDPTVTSINRQPSDRKSVV